jgi:type IV fimbrial biogenesis protein FimT
MTRLFDSARPLPAGPVGGDRGFTIVEAMVVIAITAILIGLAAPSMRSLIERNGVSQSLDSMLSSLSFARAEAIKRGVPVTMCRSANPEASTPQCSSDVAWNTGWLVFVDFGGDGSFDAAKGDILLRAQGGLQKNGTVVQIGNYASLQFLPTGTSKPFIVSFLFQSPSTPPSIVRIVCLSSGGRARVLDAAKCS